MRIADGWLMMGGTTWCLTAGGADLSTTLWRETLAPAAIVAPLSDVENRRGYGDSGPAEWALATSAASDWIVTVGRACATRAYDGGRHQAFVRRGRYVHAKTRSAERIRRPARGPPRTQRRFRRSAGGDRAAERHRPPSELSFVDLRGLTKWTVPSCTSYPAA